jgi:hypothetical protein
MNALKMLCISCTLNGLSVRGIMGSRASIIKRVTLSVSSCARSWITLQENKEWSHRFSMKLAVPVCFLQEYPVHRVQQLMN